MVLVKGKCLFAMLCKLMNHLDGTLWRNLRAFRCANDRATRPISGRLCWIDHWILLADIIMGLTVCTNSVLIIWKSSNMWQTFYNDIWAKTAWEFPCWQRQQTRKSIGGENHVALTSHRHGDFVYYFNDGLCPPPPPPLKLLKLLFFILLLITTLSGWYMRSIICDVDLERNI